MQRPPASAMLFDYSSTVKALGFPLLPSPAESLQIYRDIVETDDGFASIPYKTVGSLIFIGTAAACNPRSRYNINISVVAEN